MVLNGLSSHVATQETFMQCELIWRCKERMKWRRSYRSSG